MTIVGNVGCFISPTLIADLPVYDSEELYLTNVLLTQELSDSFSVFAGKMDTLDGDMNAFAHGRGKTQFSNMRFVFNPIVGATVPYSTLGTGFVLHPEAYIPYPPVPTPTIRGSWCLYWNFDQFLVVDPADSTRGWGLFGRAGIADANTSPIDAFVSFGCGGNVLGRIRRDDTFGVDWYYASASPQIGTSITSQFGPVGDGQGIAHEKGTQLFSISRSRHSGVKRGRSSFSPRHRSHVIQERIPARSRGTRRGPQGPSPAQNGPLGACLRARQHAQLL